MNTKSISAVLAFAALLSCNKSTTQNSKPPQTYKTIKSKGQVFCGITNLGLTNCWGLLTGPFVQGEILKKPSTGRDRICGISTKNNKIHCNLEDESLEYNYGNIPPEIRDKAIIHVALGGNVDCAVNTSHEAWCWSYHVFRRSRHWKIPIQAQKVFPSNDGALIVTTENKPMWYTFHNDELTSVKIPTEGIKDIVTVHG